MKSRPWILALTFLLMLVFSGGVQSAEAYTLKVDQIGYHPNSPKYAILEDVPKGAKFKLVIFDPGYKPRVPFKIGKVLYKIESPQIKRFIDTEMQGPGSERWVVDFSGFKQPGSFQLKIKGTDISVPIHVSDFLYWDAMLPSVRSFYLQRSGQEIVDKNNRILREASHLEDGYVHDHETGEVFFKDASGGWYNSGNYAKFVTTTGLSLAQILAVNEMDPKNMRYLRLSYALSEPGLGDVSDYLHESKYGLDWLLAMQRNDGAFYRKVAGKSFPTGKSPESDSQRRYVFGITSQDTAIGAATLAIASRNYKKADFGYAVKSLIAAERAWTFLEKHKNVVLSVDLDDDAGSREYINASGDKNYRLWAAIELYLATGKKRYADYIDAHYESVYIEPYSWQNPAILGMTNYVLYTTSKKTHSKIQNNPVVSAYFRRQIIKSADMLLKRVQSNSYHVSVLKYTRGSNRQILEHTSILLSAYRMTRKVRYRDSASQMVGYLFGMNPMNMTYITGIAPNSVKHPYHRFVQRGGISIPGLLVAGPNNYPNDGLTPKGMQAMSYIDDPKAFSVNETQIMYNASLIHVLGMLNGAYNASRSLKKSQTSQMPQ